ncbi:MAG: addiction module protein [Planctomycetota bacterium]
MARASDFASLPTDEKIQLVTDLWDQIASQGDAAVLPDWVHTEANRRLDELEKHPSKGLTADEMWRKVDESR